MGDIGSDSRRRLFGCLARSAAFAVFNLPYFCGHRIRDVVFKGPAKDSKRKRVPSGDWPARDDWP
jgi:hypothetical protein